ncbi:SusD/RagB family nutrient-binding outer membrane lipoprotein [uncultured Pontibacter sp.]|uniref:SusD/RagB family nutrient-binding outer membrane lipoprotein n=1 Tax=uncultured Pontibacter sp. TaxID=453356 RepID=UPI002624E748|nr:SusD/RagB family nutrient-binding outer membrane lipoprotein [uncultured Pontibacter sp.]
MKRIFYILPVLLMALMSCEDKLDINTNPVQPVTTSANLMLPGIQGNMAYHIYSHARFSSYHSMYLTSRYGTRAIEDRWDYNQITRLGAWRWHYFDVGSNAIGLIDRAELENSANYMGVAKIMLGFSYLTATSSFGEMPVKEAYTGDFSPLYDTQEYVYEEVARLLDEGIADIERSGAEARTMNAASDLIYQGDLGKWVAFANGLKARMYLHTASFNNGYDNVLNHVNLALNNWRDPIYNYSSNPQRDWERNMWGPAKASPQWNFADVVNMLDNTVPTTFFMNYLIVNEPNIKRDPRVYKLMTPGKNNVYQGAVVSRGLEGKVMDDFPNLYNGYWTSDNSPLPYMLKEELLFIKAEAAFHKGDKGTAFEAYREGITTNMQRLNVPQDSLNNYMASPKVKKTAAELQISDIMTQKYIALYLQPEAWVDMRRYQYQATAYPGIEYPSNVLPEFAGRWIQRLPYDPQTEYIYNPQEVARLGATARDWVTKPMWVFENSSL